MIPAFSNEATGFADDEGYDKEQFNLVPDSNVFGRGYIGEELLGNFGRGNVSSKANKEMLKSLMTEQMRRTGSTQDPFYFMIDRPEDFQTGLMGMNDQMRQYQEGGDPFLDNPLNQFVYGDNIPMAQNGVETNSDTDIQKLVYVQQLLQTQYQQMLETVKANPEILENNEERVIFEENLSQLQADMEIVDAQLGELQSSKISESQRIPLSDTTITSNVIDSTGYDMTKGLDAIWNASDLSRFIAQSEGVSSPAYQYGGSLPKFEEGGPSRVCTTGPNGEITCPDDSHQYHDSVIEGDAAHQQFEDMINKPAFSGIKDKWMEAYIKNACASQGQTNSSGRSLEFAGIDFSTCESGDPQFASGYDADRLWSEFMNVNRQLQGFKSIGYGQSNDYKYGDFGGGGNEYGTIADKYGMTKFDENQIRGWQGMFASLRELKNTEGHSPTEEQFFSNLSTSLEGEGWAIGS